MISLLSFPEEWHQKGRWEVLSRLVWIKERPGFFLRLCYEGAELPVGLGAPVILYYIILYNIY